MHVYLLLVDFCVRRCLKNKNNNNDNNNNNDLSCLDNFLQFSIAHPDRGPGRNNISDMRSVIALSFALK